MAKKKPPVGNPSRKLSDPCTCLGVSHLAEAFDALEHGQKEDGPGGEKAERQRPAERTEVVNAVRQLEHEVTAKTAGRHHQWRAYGHLGASKIKTQTKANTNQTY